MVTRNQHLDQRMNWFDRQFLRAQDFADESDYQVDRLRRHLRLLHTPGVGEGLLVRGAVDATEATVDAGTALDDQGRPIVLLTSTEAIDLPAATGSAELYVGYGEAEAEQSKDPGIVGNTRIRESPRFSFRVGTGPVPASGVLLAKLTLADGKLTAEPDNEVRTRAGAAIGDVSVFSLTLRRVGQPASAWPRFTASDANQVSLAGDLRLESQRALLFQDDGRIRSTGDLRLLTGATPGQARLVVGADGAVRVVGTSDVSLLRVDANAVAVGEPQSARPLAVHGSATIDGDLTVGATKTISAPGRLHVFGDELLYLLNKSGVIIGREWGGTGALQVQGPLTLISGLQFGGAPPLSGISRDVNLAAASDATVPSERAVKSYVDRHLAIQAGEASVDGLDPGGSDLFKAQPVTFSSAFAAPPTVFVAVRVLDADHNRNLRFDVFANNVSQTGFNLTFKSWADTRIYGLIADWLAFGPLP